MTVGRIKINLSKIFSDYRKFAYITIDSKWKTVEDLELHILHLFGIKTTIYLTTEDGILIPTKEKIDVISLEDSIIINLMENNNSASSAQNNLDISQSSNEDVEIKQKRKRKRKRKNNQIITAVNKEIVEENGLDDEFEDVIEKRVTKFLKKGNAVKDEVEVVVEPIIKEIPKLSIISSIPKIVYGF